MGTRAQSFVIAMIGIWGAYLLIWLTVSQPHTSPLDATLGAGLFWMIQAYQERSRPV